MRRAHRETLRAFPTDFRGMQVFAAEVARQLGLPIADVIVTAGAEAANVRRITIQVVDRLETQWTARWEALVWLSSTDGGDTAAADGSTIVNGTAIQTITTDGAWRFISDANGRIVIDVELSGAGTRYVAVSIAGGQVRYSSAFAWT